MLTYQQAIAYLESLINYERTPIPPRAFKLDRMEYLLGRVGNPHRKLRSLHIAGTKGKGSTTALVASMLGADGFQVGRYTSPHLVSFRERIRIGKKLISEDEVGQTLSQVQPELEGIKSTELGSPSFFEAYTLLAITYFAARNLDFVVFEVGLGGRLDATNVITPLVCGITTVGYDHMQVLGDTLDSIAREKAGIIKPGCPVVSAPQVPEAAQALEEVCAERGARLVWVEIGPKTDKSVAVQKIRGDLNGQVVTIHVLSGEYPELYCPLLGDHQLPNIGVAVGMVELLSEQGFVVGPEAIRRGLAEVDWPGRLQVVGRSPWVVLDSAHDQPSALALRESLASLFPHERLFLLLGISKDKDIRAMGEILCPLAHEVIFTTVNLPRATPAAELESQLGDLCRHSLVIPDPAAAIGHARKQASAGDLICITGSIFLVGEAMKVLGIDHEGSPARR